MIGILALQGAYQAHANHLDKLDAKHCFVREPAQLDNCAGLIIPGGESSTFLKMMQNEPAWFDAFSDFYQTGKALFGTCAGVILLAKQVTNPAQNSFGFIDIEVERNGYGRQLQSCVVHGNSAISDKPSEMVFIRAPRIKHLTDKVKPLAHYNDEVVAVEQGQCLATCFHPELGSDLSWHQYFLDKVTPIN